MILSLLMVKCNKSEFNDKLKLGPEDIAAILAAAAAAEEASAAKAAATYRSSSPEGKLRILSSKGDTAKVEKFLAEGIDPNAADELGTTALMLAAQGGHAEVVSLLLDAGADVNAVDTYRNTALMLAASTGRVEVINPLLQAGAKVNTSTFEGHTALMEATRTRRAAEAVSLLLNAGAEVNASTATGFTALMRAAQNGRKEAVSLLLQAGADVNAVNTYRETALMLAARINLTSVVKMLELYQEIQKELPEDEEGQIVKIESVLNHILKLKSSINYLGPFASRLIEIVKHVKYNEANTEAVFELLKLSNSKGEIDGTELELIHKHLLLYLYILNSKYNQTDIASSILNYISTPKILSGEMSLKRYPALILAFAKDKGAVTSSFGKSTKFISAFNLEELKLTYDKGIRKGVQDLIKICEYRGFSKILEMLKGI